ncbi:MAG: MBL fold metallo-hydrolase [Oscillospiraceae bacterium]|nr:MBL fold metallo-hydrolase [Oscillospiraceae bacterium]
MQGSKITITWYGTASVRITAGSSQLLIDPFFPFPDSRIRIADNAFDGCSHILITHGHFDHIGSIREIVRPGTAVYCTKAPYRSLRRKGVPEKNLKQIRAGEVFKIGAFRITAHPGKHIRLNAWDCLRALCSRRVRQNRKGILQKLRKFVSCREKKESLCYQIEAYGKRILMLGSLGIAPDTAYPKGVDLALFPYQGSGQLFEIAAGIYRKLKPKAVLLIHFDDTFPPFSSDVDTSEIQDYLKKRTVVYQLENGGSLEL